MVILEWPLFILFSLSGLFCGLVLVGSVSDVGDVKRFIMTYDGAGGIT